MSARIEQFLSENKVLIGIVGALALLAPIGYGLAVSSMEKRSLEYDNRIYRFRQEVFEKYREGTLSSTEFISRLRELRGELGNYRGLYPFLLKFSDEMVQRKDHEGAEEALLWGEGKYSQGHLLGDLFRLRLATLYEDTGRSKKALHILLDLTANEKTPLLRDKLYLDLSRLYLSLGDREKAEAGLDYVLEHSKEQELVRLAELMKEELREPL